MKNGPSLQEERDALLEHIHASRAAYRRMLTEVNTAEQQKFDNRSMKLAPEQRNFPRSMTVRWIVKHPYLSALAVAGTVAVVAIGPRRAMRAIGDRTVALKDRAVALQPSTTTARKRAGPALGALTAIATTMLRNPARVQMAVRTLSSVAQYLKRRRQKYP